MAREFNGGALHAETESEERHLALSRKADRGDLSFNSTRAEAPGDENAVCFPEDPLRPLPLDIFRFDPVDVHARLMVDAAMDKRFGQTLVAFLQPGVLAHERHHDLVLGMLDFLHHRIPFAQVRRTRLQSQLPDDQFIQAFLAEHDRHFIDGLHILGRNDRVLLDVAEHRDFALHFGRNVAVGAAQEDVRLNTDLPQLVHGVLGRLGFQLSGRTDVRHQRQVDVEHIFTPDVVRHLANRLEKRQAFDIADGPADFDDRDVHALGDPHDALFDLVGNVRHDLHGPAEIVSPSLLGDDGIVDATSRVIVFLGQGQRGVALVMAEIQVGLCTVVGHVHFAVLVWIHGARIDVDVRIEFEEGDLESPALEQIADRGRRQSLA